MDTQLVRGAGNVHSWFSGGKGEKQEPGVVAGLPRPARVPAWQQGLSQPDTS